MLYAWPCEGRNTKAIIMPCVWHVLGQGMAFFMTHVSMTDMFAGKSCDTEVVCDILSDSIVGVRRVAMSFESCAFLPDK